MILAEKFIQEIILEGKQSSKAERLIEKLYSEDIIKNLYSVANVFNDEERYTVSLLRNIYLDTDITFNDLAKFGFRESYLSCIELISMKKNQSFDQYIEAIISSNNIPVIDIKIAELRKLIKKCENNCDLIKKYQTVYDKIKQRRDEL